MTIQNQSEEPINPKQVAEWMIKQLEVEEELYQQPTANKILELFGEEFVALDANDVLGIGRKVLYQFKKMTGDTVVWVAVQGDWTAGFWRKRDDQDNEGRRQYFY